MDEFEKYYEMELELVLVYQIVIYFMNFSNNNFKY